jgi:hypothetical protein
MANFDTNATNHFLLAIFQRDRRKTDNFLVPCQFPSWKLPRNLLILNYSRNRLTFWQTAVFSMRTIVAKSRKRKHARSAIAQVSFLVVIE